VLEIMRGRTTFQMGISSPDQLQDWLDSNPEALGLAFVGRSNVGKSSLINSLFGKGIARTSNTPGRTREINIFKFELGERGIAQELEQPLFLFDLPGYGFAEVSKELSKNWNTLMDVFFSDISPYVSLVNLQDSRHPNQASDKEFHHFIKTYHYETFLVFNKIDKLKTQKERAALEKLKPALFKEYKWVKQIYFVSAEKGTGVKPLEESLISNLLVKNEVIKHSVSPEED
jgi:GTP-binding protein